MKENPSAKVDAGDPRPAVWPDQRIIKDPQHVLRKGEEFSISLRNQKRMEILNQKRQRKLGIITKAKFLGQVNTKNRLKKIEFYELATIRQQVRSLNTMLGKPLSDPDCYPISDFIQIIKELKAISTSEQTELIEFLRQDEQVMNVLMVLLTRDYVLVPPGGSSLHIGAAVWPVEASELI